MLSALTYFPYFVRGENLRRNYTQSISKFQPIIKSAEPQFLPRIFYAFKKNIASCSLNLYLVVVLYNLWSFVGKSSTMERDDTGFTQQTAFLKDSSLQRGAPPKILAMLASFSGTLLLSIITHLHGYSLGQQTHMLNVCLNIFILFENYSLL